MKQQRGLTLIELLVAMLIFAILGIMSYRGLTNISDNAAHINEAIDNWRRIERGINIIERELTQIIGPLTNTGAIDASQLFYVSNQNNFASMRFLSLDGNNEQLLQTRFVVENGQLLWQSKPLQSTDDPISTVLFEGVTGFKVQLLSNQKSYDSWPVGGLAALQQGAATVSGNTAAEPPIPDAIDFEITLSEQGTMRRLIPIR